MIDGKNLFFFDKPVKNNLRTYDNIQETVTGQGDDYATSCLLDYNYFNKYCKMIAIDSSKQEALDTDTINQFYRKSSLTRKCKYNNVFHYWKSERNHFRFFIKNCETIENLFYFNIILV